MRIYASNLHIGGESTARTCSGVTICLRTGPAAGVVLVDEEPTSAPSGFSSQKIWTTIWWLLGNGLAWLMVTSDFK